MIVRKYTDVSVTKYSVRVEFGPAGHNVSDIFGPAGLKYCNLKIDKTQYIYNFTISCRFSILIL